MHFNEKTVEKMIKLKQKMSQETIGNTGESLKVTVKYIDELIDVMFPVLGLSDMDFTIEGLKRLENQINLSYPLGHEPIFTTVLFIGVYVGETMRRQIPGFEWDYTPTQDIEKISLKCKIGDGTFTAKPIMRVKKFWFDREDSIRGWVNMIKDIQSGDLDMENSTPFQWQERPDGTQVRFTKMFKGNKK